MVVVVAIISLVVGLALPAINSGVDTLRLNSGVTAVVTLFNSGLSRAERSQQAVEISISQQDNALWIRAPEAKYERRIDMPEGVTITRILPADMTGQTPEIRDFFLYPGGSVPQFGVELRNRRGRKRMVSVDPITGVPRIKDTTEEVSDAAQG